MAHAHLIIGPVGSGKSTYAIELSQRHDAVRFNLDEWMAVLFGDDERPAENRVGWYTERTERCVEQIWRVAAQTLAAGTDVVLELGLIQREPRAAFYGRLDAEALPHTVYVVDAPREVRRARVQRRNLERGETFAMEVPDAIFELASDLWHAPEGSELEDRDVRFITDDR